MTKVFSVGAGRRDRFVHASRRAPRCLPCNYTDPLEDTGVGAAINRFNAVKACPCTLEALCKGTDNTHIINSWDCRFTKWRPAWWYFAHVRPSRTSNFLSELCIDCDAAPCVNFLCLEVLSCGGKPAEQGSSHAIIGGSHASMNAGPFC